MWDYQSSSSGEECFGVNVYNDHLALQNVTITNSFKEQKVHSAIPRRTKWIK